MDLLTIIWTAAQAIIYAAIAGVVIENVAIGIDFVYGTSLRFNLLPPFAQTRTTTGALPRSANTNNKAETVTATITESYPITETEHVTDSETLTETKWNTKYLTETQRVAEIHDVTQHLTKTIKFTNHVTDTKTVTVTGKALAPINRPIATTSTSPDPIVFWMVLTTVLSLGAFMFLRHLFRRFRGNEDTESLTDTPPSLETLFESDPSRLQQIKPLSDYEIERLSTNVVNLLYGDMSAPRSEPAQLDGNLRQFFTTILSTSSGYPLTRFIAKTRLMEIIKQHQVGRPHEATLVQSPEDPYFPTLYLEPTRPPPISILESTTRRPRPLTQIKEIEQSPEESEAMLKRLAWAPKLIRDPNDTDEEGITDQPEPTQEAAHESDLPEKDSIEIEKTTEVKQPNTVQESTEQSTLSLELTYETEKDDGNKMFRGYRVPSASLSSSEGRDSSDKESNNDGPTADSAVDGKKVVEQSSSMYLVPQVPVELPAPVFAPHFPDVNAESPDVLLQLPTSFIEPIEVVDHPLQSQTTRRHVDATEASAEPEEVEEQQPQMDVFTQASGIQNQPDVPGTAAEHIEPVQPDVLLVPDEVVEQIPDEGVTETPQPVDAEIQEVHTQAPQPAETPNSPSERQLSSEMDVDESGLSAIVIPPEQGFDDSSIPDVDSSRPNRNDIENNAGHPELNYRSNDSSSSSYSQQSIPESHGNSSASNDMDGIEHQPGTTGDSDHVGVGELEHRMEMLRLDQRPSSEPAPSPDLEMSEVIHSSSESEELYSPPLDLPHDPGLATDLSQLTLQEQPYLPLSSLLEQQQVLNIPLGAEAIDQAVAQYQRFLDTGENPLADFTPFPENDQPPPQSQQAPTQDYDPFSFLTDPYEPSEPENAGQGDVPDDQSMRDDRQSGSDGHDNHDDNNDSDDYDDDNNDDNGGYYGATSRLHNEEEQLISENLIDDVGSTTQQLTSPPEDPNARSPEFGQPRPEPIVFPLESKHDRFVGRPGFDLPVWPSNHDRSNVPGDEITYSPGSSPPPAFMAEGEAPMAQPPGSRSSSELSDAPSRVSTPPGLAAPSPPPVQADEHQVSEDYAPGSEQYFAELQQATQQAGADTDRTRATQEAARNEEVAEARAALQNLEEDDEAAQARAALQNLEEDDTSLKTSSSENSSADQPSELEDPESTPEPAWRSVRAAARRASEDMETVDAARGIGRALARDKEEEDGQKPTEPVADQMEVNKEGRGTKRQRDSDEDDEDDTIPFERRSSAPSLPGSGKTEEAEQSQTPQARDNREGGEETRAPQEQENTEAPEVREVSQPQEEIRDDESQVSEADESEWTMRPDGTLRRIP